MVALLLLCVRLFRLPSYEIFLRGHQALAIAIAYALWMHIPASSKLPRIYLFTSGGTFLTTFALEFFTVLYRNIGFRRGCSRALIASQNGTVRMTIFPSRPWRFQAGQYINLWVPSISWSSSLQSHPFMITSWKGGPTPSLDLLIEPRHGFTRKLLDCAEEYQQSKMEPADEEPKRPFGCATDSSEGPKSSDFRTVMFSGPHGSIAPVGDYGKVLMIATGFGIAAQLPFLKGLIQGFNRSEVRTRNLHLLWQLQDLGKFSSTLRCQRLTHAGDEKPGIDLLDRALREDTLEHGYVS